MSKYLAYFKARIRQETFYKFNYWMQLLSAWVLFYVEFYVWQAVFGNGAELQGITSSGIFSYLFYSHLLRTFYGSGIDEKTGNDYREGHIVIDRMRPVNLATKYLADDLGRGCVQTLTLVVPLIGMMLLTGTQMSLRVEDGFVFISFAVLSYIVYFVLNYILGLLCFWTESILGIYMFKTACFSLLSGVYIPLDFYPDWLARLCDVLPFKMVFYAPLSRLIHPESSPIPLFYSYIFWLMLLGTVFVLLQRAAFKRAVVQGG
jgi:ABC-2 type transport system permease protein